MKVSFVPVSDYAAVVEALASDKLDLAWLGGFTFVQANIRTKGTAIPLVQREEDARFTSKFITADPNIKTWPTPGARSSPLARRRRPRAT
jgi:phosphonate transport system substrate-binding protein